MYQKFKKPKNLKYLSQLYSGIQKDQELGNPNTCVEVG